MKTISWLLKTIRILLTVVWYINIVLIVIAFSMLTFKFITSDSVEFSNPVKYSQKPNVVKLESLTPNAYNIVIQRDQGTLKMDLRKSPGYIAAAYFFLISLEVLAMTIIYQLRKFFDSIQERAPFKYDNIRRLHITALCFVLLTPLHILLGISTAITLKEHVKDFNLMNLVWTESFTGLILGAVIYIMADIFKYGFELQKENGEFV
ncbi:DUF2975 domain-containing protein [Mucilaginibacter sp.]|jgi:hypothetical protein|uniref:DUF2975 domain-containing protein n=1 Tax=Mucilaginibacter sp. TaxID=1882438 RepID=UPI0035625082